MNAQSHGTCTAVQWECRENDMQNAQLNARENSATPAEIVDNHKNLKYIIICCLLNSIHMDASCHVAVLFVSFDQPDGTATPTIPAT